jgi:hypothetical protein
MRPLLTRKISRGLNKTDHIDRNKKKGYLLPGSCTVAKIFSEEKEGKRFGLIRG